MKLCISAMCAGLFAMGCSGGKVVEGSGDQLPRPFTVAFRAFERGRRHVFYQLDADGSLRYGGGRDASGRLAPREAGVLTDADRLELWRIIQRHNLLEADGEVFPDEDRVRYELDARAGRRHNSFSAADEDVPGLKQLDELLFKLQARNRFKEQTEGIIPSAEEQEPKKK